jgi:hypothetical protein
MLATATARTSYEPIPAGALERWRPTSLALDSWLVLRLARYRRREAVEPEVREIAEAMVARAAAIIEPQAVVGTRQVAAAGGAGARREGPSGFARPGRRGPSPATPGGAHSFSGQAVGRLLDGCPLAAAFALTLGPRLEAEVAALTAARQLLEAFLLDTAGWAAIELAVRALRQDLRGRACPRGLWVTHRLAPGYGDWPLAEQRELLSVLEDGGGLVRLSPHGVLLPFKSVTGLFGLAPDRP